MAERLPPSEGGAALPGGLFVRRDRPKNLQQASNPVSSRLGLDKLAAEKARERAAAAAAQPMAPPPKRPMLGHLRADEGDGEASGEASSGARKYRRPREDTPSHAGGVNVATAQRIKERVTERLKGAGQVFTTAAESSRARE